MAITREDIERMLGPIDNQLAVEIAATDATATDLAKALAWLQSDEALVNDGDHLPIGKVAELIGILETVDDDEGFTAPIPAADDWA